jgi:chemotaxis signal transduction protein
MTITTDRTNFSEAQTSLLENRFILTQLQSYTLVFPATWVAEVLHIDRSHILALPFYDPLVVGIVDRNGQTIPLINTAQSLGLASLSLPERVLVVRLNEAAEGLKNVSFIIDRLIGTTTRNKLPSDLFIADRVGKILMIKPTLVPTTIWQPQYKLSN